MSLFDWLRGGQAKSAATPESFQELMAKYDRAWGNAQEQRRILARAAAMAQASGDMLQQLEVVGKLNAWKQKYER